MAVRHLQILASEAHFLASEAHFVAPTDQAFMLIDHLFQLLYLQIFIVSLHFFYHLLILPFSLHLGSPDPLAAA